MKSVKSQKRMAAEIMKIGKNRVHISPTNLEEVKQAITREDVKKLIKKGIIKKKKINGISSFRKKKHTAQKKKGRRKGVGSRKGKKGARTPKKRNWINKIRIQRRFLLNIKNKLKKGQFRRLYLMCKGGFFRSKAHLKLFINEHKLLEKK